jgi:tRNA threonylcarbamoyladenosine biosynthesis protein TsaB
VDAALLPTAGDIARLAERAFRAGQGVPPEHALPVYLRDKVATPKI